MTDIDTGSHDFGSEANGRGSTAGKPPGRRAAEEPRASGDLSRNAQTTPPGGLSRRRRQARVVLPLLAFLLMMALGAIFAMQNGGGYSATAVVAVSPRDDLGTSADLIGLSAQKYAAYVPSEAAMSEASTAADVPLRDLANATKAEVEPETANLSITVKNANADVAARAAQTLAKAVVSRASSDQQVRLEIIRSATGNGAAPGISVLVLLGVAGVAALLAAALTWALVSRPHSAEAARL